MFEGGGSMNTSTHCKNDSLQRIVEKSEVIHRKNSVVLMREMTKHRAKWKLGKIVDTIVGKDEASRLIQATVM